MFFCVTNVMRARYCIIYDRPAVVTITMTMKQASCANYLCGIMMIIEWCRIPRGNANRAVDTLHQFYVQYYLGIFLCLYIKLDQFRIVRLSTSLHKVGTEHFMYLLMSIKLQSSRAHSKNVDVRYWHNNPRGNPVYTKNCKQISP